MDRKCIIPYALLASQSTNVQGTAINQSSGKRSCLTDAGFQRIAAVRFGHVDGEGDSELGTRVHVLGPLRGVCFLLN